MASNNGGAFSDVEQTRRDRYEIKRRDRYLLLIVVAILIGAIALMLSTTTGISKDFFLINVSRIRSFDDLMAIDFRADYYFMFIAYVSIVWYGLILKKPLFKKDGLIRNIGYLIFLPLNILFAIYIRVLKMFNKNRKDDKDETLLNAFLKLCYFPFNFLFFTHKEGEAFKFVPCWYGKIEKDLFKQVHNKIDEIVRVNTLIALKDFPDIFTNVEYKKLVRLFKNENQLIDYLKITEGYLTEKNKKKYDELFYSENKKTLKKFRAFNGRDKVFFSMDYVIFKTTEQSKIFEEFLTKRFLKGSTRVSAEIFTYFKMIVNDKKYEYNLLGITKDDLENGRYSKSELKELRIELNAIREARDNEDTVFIENLLKERLVVWFKFYFTRTILQRYCNIPAGLLVVKIEDYSMRMITEVYNDKKLVNISRNQNDGSSKSFNGDGLVNLFLFTWNAFLYGRKIKVLQDVEFNINTISDTSNMYDDDVNVLVKNMEDEIQNKNIK